MVEIRNNQQVELQKGMQVRFLNNDHCPAYEVTAITTFPPSLTLKCISPLLHSRSFKEFPPEITITSKYTVGRNPDTSHLQIGHSFISRSHAVFHPNKDGILWYYTHYGTNSGTVTHPTEPVQIIDRTLGGAQPKGDATKPEIFLNRPTRVEYEGTIMKFPGDDSQQDLPPLAIVDGMTLQFHPDMPVYEATITSENGNPKLVLQRQEDRNNDKRYPSRIEVNHDRGIIMGRREPQQNIVVLPHPGISATHALIAWDQHEQAFMYEALGKQPPIIRMPKMLSSLAQKYDGMKPPAQSQLAELQTFIAELKSHKALAQNVQKLEIGTHLTPWYERDTGARTEDSQKGYEMWLRAYELLYREHISEGTSKKLIHMADVLKEMASDRSSLRDIENYDEPDIGRPPELSKLKDGSPRASEVAKYAAEKVAKLEQTGEIYLVSGFCGHHTVTRIAKDASGYLVTNYDAGPSAEYAPDGKHVLGTCEKRLHPECNIDEFVWLLTERKLSHMLSYPSVMLNQEVESMLGPDIVRSHQVIPQQKGNCTTRSTREMLRDVLDPQTFEHLHSYVSNPNIAIIEDLIAALELKQKILQGGNPQLPPPMSPHAR